MTNNITEYIDLIGLTGIHPESSCSGRVCVVHNPTENRMSHLPLLWRADRKIFERICLHGVGHPDLDMIPYWKEKYGEDWGWAAVHGCCSELCCQEK